MLRNPTPSMFAAHVRKMGTPVRTGNLIAAVLLASDNLSGPTQADLIAIPH